MSRKNLLDGKEPESLSDALYIAAHQMRGGIKVLAACMPGINYNTLNHKLNILNDTHHLKPDEIEQIVRITEDQRIVDVLADMLGLLVFKPEEHPVDNKALIAASKVLADMSAFLKSLSEGAEDNVWVKTEVKELKKHGHVLIKTLLGIMHGAEQAYQRSNDDAD